MKYPLLIIFLFLLPLSGVSQEEYNHYSFNDLYAFDVTTTFDLYQDTKGCFWFGTNEGLVKFNGVDFTFFTKDGYAKSSTNIKEDAAGRIWYSNFRGQLFFIENDSVKTAIATSSKQQFVQEYFVAYPYVYYIETQGSALFKINILTQQKDIIYACGAGKMIACGFSTHNRFLFAQVHTINRPQKPEQQFEFFSFDPETQKIQLLAKQNMPRSSSKYQLFVKDKRLYFTRSQENITEINTITNGTIQQHTPCKVSGVGINQFNTDEQAIYVLTKRGFYKYDTLSGGDTKNVHFHSSSISKLYTDRENNWWVATLNNGFFIIPNKELKNIPLANNRIISTCRDSIGNIYYISYNGHFYRFSILDNSIELLQKFKSEKIKKLVFNPFNNYIYILGGNQIYNTRQRCFETLPSNNLLQQKKDILFLNQQDAVASTYGRTQAENIYQSELRSKWGSYTRGNRTYPFRILRSVNATHLIRESDSTFYVSYIDGLHYYIWGKSFLIKHQGSPLFTAAIAADKDGTVWLVTDKKQLLKIKNGKVLSQRNLPFIATKIFSKGHQLFMSDKHVIYRLDKATLVYEKFDKTDGLLSERIMDLYEQTDTLIIIGEHYAQKIPCAFENFNAIAPILRIESIKLFDKPVNKAALNFDYEEDNITIEFSSSSIRSQENYSYRYRLNGGDWQRTTSKAPFARFSKLAPGQYNFQVYAINEDGVKSTIQVVHFEIDKHITQKWWFITLIFVVLAGTSFIIIRRWYMNVQQRKEDATEKQRLKKEVYKSKIAAIRAQMNPHFMFNALNTIQEFILTNQKEIASEYLADFADLMRKYLDQSMHEEILLVDELEALDIYLRLENLRFDGTLSYAIERDPAINIFEIKIPVMLLQPFIENAIKHGLLHKEGIKKLTIGFKKISSNRIECIIQDNGVGRKTASEITMHKTSTHIPFSTKAIDQKVKLVNENSSKHLSIIIADVTENETIIGTKVMICFDI